MPAMIRAAVHGVMKTQLGARDRTVAMPSFENIGV
jgi:hypothetical protein